MDQTAQMGESTRAHPCPDNGSNPPGLQLNERSPARIFAVATNPEIGASTRFRVLQWKTHLERAGFSLCLDAFFSPAGTEVLYRPGRRLAKLAHICRGTVRRSLNLLRASRTAEILLIHREVYPLGRRLFWTALERFRGPIVYDYDDAMFLPQREDRGLLGRLERLDTPKAIMELSDVVLAGNDFLAAYAQRYAKKVVLLPTCIDTERFRPSQSPHPIRRRLIVGWIGSHSTAKYLRSLYGVLARVAERVPFQMHIVGNPQAPLVSGVEVTYTSWSMTREVEDFLRCDIGVYPLWDDAWAQGKCGFKAIQFMACGIPVVAAAVGANRQIIQDGMNGYLASTEDEWVDKLTRLLLDTGLRTRFGEAGRRTVEERFSLDAHAPALISTLRGTLNGSSRQRSA